MNLSLSRGRSAKWFARVPAAVFLDDRLTKTQLLVYCVLASNIKRGRDTTQIGQRLIADNLRLTQPAISTALKTLEMYGHLEIQAGGSGKRSTYRLVSAVFGPAKSISYRSNNQKKRRMIATSSEDRRSAIEEILAS